MNENPKIPGVEEVKHNAGERITFMSGHHTNKTNFDKLKDYVKEAGFLFEKIQDISSNEDQGLYVRNEKGDSLFKTVENKNIYYKRPLLEKHKELRKKDSFVLMDIKSVEKPDLFKNNVGEQKEKLTEILEYSLVKYSKDWEVLDRVDGFGNPSKEYMSVASSISRKLKYNEKDAFLSMEKHERQFFLDLIERTRMEKGDDSFSPAKIVKGKEGNKLIKSSLINDLEGKTTKEISQLIDENRGVFDSVVDYEMMRIKNGIRKPGERTQTQVAHQIKDFLERNNKEMYISYSSKNMDFQVLSEFLQEKFEDADLKPKDHINYMDILEETKPEKETLISKINKSKNKESISDTLRSKKDRNKEGVKSTSRYNIEGLEGLIKAIDDEVYEKTNLIMDTLNPKKIKTEDILDASDQIEEGDILKKVDNADSKEIAEKIINDKKSFAIVKDKETGIPEIQKINKAFIEKREELEQFYKFEGFYDLSKDKDASSVGMRLYNPIEDETMYIVRDGTNKEKDLKEILRSNYSPIKRDTLNPIKDIDAPGLSKEPIKMKELKEVVDEKGDHLFKKFVSADSYGGAESYRSFDKFNAAEKYIAFDIETMGDTRRSGQYSITEVSLQEIIKGKGPTENSMTRLVRPSDLQISQLENMISQYSINPTILNTWDDTERRTFVDLMRYSRESDSLSEKAVFKGTSIEHNTLVENHLTEDGKINYGKVIDDHSYYEKHLKSGLNTLKSVEYTQADLADEMASYFKRNKDQVFLSYNGRTFDMPVIYDFLRSHNEEAIRKGIDPGEVVSKADHLDLYQVLKSTGTSPSDMEEVLGFKPKNLRLQTLTANLEEKGSAHSAEADVRDTARLVEKLEPLIKENKDESLKKAIYQSSEAESKYDISDAELEFGDRFRVKKSYQAYQEDDLSFITRRDPDTGKLIVDPYGNNKYVTESRGYYEFQGFYELQEAGEEKMVAMRMHNPLTDEDSYIVKQGINAYSDLESTLHSHFTYANLTDEQVLKDRELVEKDRARRAYDRLFDVSGAGQGVYIDKNSGELIERSSVGFSGAKKFFAVAEKEIEIDRRYELNKDTYSKKLIEQGVAADKKEAEEIMQTLSSKEKEELIEKVLYKPKDQQYYRELRERLKDEQPVYGEAIRKIDDAYYKELREATLKQDTQEIKRIAQLRDEALFEFHEGMRDKLDEYGGNTQLITGQSKSQRVFEMEDVEGKKIRFNISDYESARGSIYWSARNATDTSSRSTEKEIGKLLNIVDSMTYNKSLSKKEAKDLKFEIRESGSSYTGAGMIADKFFGEDPIRGVKIEREREVPNLESNILMKKEEVKKYGDSLIDKILENKRKETPQFYFNKEEGKLKLNVTDELVDMVGGRYQEVDGKVIGRGNIEAIEEVANSILYRRKRDGFSDQDHKRLNQIAIDIVDDGSLRADIYAYDLEDHTSIYKAITEGRGTDKALKISIPLISDEGVQKQGGLIVNAHKVAKIEKDEAKLVSTVHNLSESIRFDIQSAIQKYEEGDFGDAQRYIDSKIIKEVQKQAGVSSPSSGISQNDMMLYTGNASDMMKQAYIDVENASIQDFYYKGFERDGVKYQLTDEDFQDTAFYYDKEGKKRLKKDLTFMDLKSAKQNIVKMHQVDWFNERFSDYGYETFISGVKSDRAGKYVSSIDGRDTIIFGAYSDAKRDNMIQWTNAFMLDESKIKELEQINDIKFDQSIITPLEREIEPGEKSNYRMNAKFAIMDDAMISKRIQSLHQTEEGRGILERSNLLDEEGQIRWERAPRTFEQQVSVSEDVFDQLTVKREKNYKTDTKFILGSEQQIGSIVSPGEIIGKEIEEDGTERIIRNERKDPILIENLSEDGKQLSVSWDVQAHKIMPGGDKGTMLPYSQELIDAITGTEGVSFIHNPDVSKHHDFNLLYSGDVIKLAERVRETEGPQKQEMIDLIHKQDLGIEWIPEENRFLDITNTERGLQPGESYKELVGRLDETFESPLFSDIEREVINLNEDGTKTKVRTYRNQAIVSGVYEYTDYYGDEGTKYLSHSYDQEGKLITHYGEERGGVRFGHRELRTFHNLGMKETYFHVLDSMKYRAQDRAGKNISQAEYLSNIQTAALSFDKGPEEGDIIFRHSDFNPIPTEGKAREDFSGTIFDSDFVQQKSGREDGFWLELPGYKEGDIHVKPTIDVDGNKVELDKLFIPITQNNYTKGNRYNDQLQGIVQSIIRRAEAVDKAESPEDRVKEINRIGSLIEDYRSRLSFDMSASKGLAGEVIKTELPNSATNVTSKIIDEHRSEAFKKTHGIDTEFTLISREAAIGMGISEKIDAGEEVFGAVIRYPVFNDKAITFNRLLIDDTIEGNDVHITEKTARLLNADSDGDALFITTPQDEGVQREFKHMSTVHEGRFSEQIAKAREHGDQIVNYLSGVTGESVDTIHNVINESDFSVLEKNTIDEFSSKIGKSIIGSASNYNLSLQQASSMFYAPDSAEHKIIQEFGSAVEQRIISSKHGASEFATDFIRALNRNDWDEAKRIDIDYYEGMFTKDYEMDKVKYFMEDNIKTIDQGLYNESFSLGKGQGLGFTRPEDVARLVQGDIYNPGNQFLNAMRYITEIETPDKESIPTHPLGPDAGVEFHSPENKVISDSIDEIPDLTNFNKEEFKEEINKKNIPKTEFTSFDTMDNREAIDNLDDVPILDTSSGPSRRPGSGALMAAGLGGAYAGIMGAAMLGSTTPIKEDFENYTKNISEEAKLKEAFEKEFVGSNYLGVHREPEYIDQGYRVTAKATGDSLRTYNLPNSISSSLGVSPEMRMNVRDNVSDLTNNWYRDVVQENV